MITTRNAVMNALLVVIEEAAATLPKAGARRNATLPVDIDKGGVDFLLADGDPGEPEPELCPDPPFYIIDRAEIAVTVAESDGARDAALAAALAALDAALAADQTLGGRLKGRMLWSLMSRNDAPVAGASSDVQAIVAVTLEYETNTRLAV